MLLVETKRIKKEEVTVVSSLDIAETFEKHHKNVLRDIKNLDCSKEFRQLNFEQSYYLNEQNKKQPMYYMTKDGFVLLVMGYTGERAAKFKEAYIKQFNAMEKMLLGKIKERIKGIATRHILTDILKQSGENERMHGHAYSTYTNLIYKTLFNVPANKLRQDLGIGLKDNIRDYLTQEQLQSVQHLESLINGLIAVGWGYEQIKEFVQTNNIKRIS